MTLRPFLVPLLACVATAQQFTLKPVLHAGESFEIEFVHIREDARRPQVSGRSRTPVAVRVLEAGPKGFLLEWKPGATEFSNPEIVKNPIAAAAANAVKDLALVLVLGAGGEFVRLKNEAEVAAKLQSMMDAMLATIGAQIPDAGQRKNVEALVRRLLSPQVLIASATREPQTYFGLNGAAVDMGKPATVTIQQPSPFGAGTIPARFTLTLESMDAHSAKLSSTTTYDPKSLAEFVGGLLAQAAPNLPKSAEPPQLRLSDTARYTYNRAFGLMNEVIVDRRTTAGDALNRLDGWEIHLTRRPGE